MRICKLTNKNLFPGATSVVAERRRKYFGGKENENSVRGNRKSDRCYICRKKGHYAKQCPHKGKEKVIHSLSEIADLENADVESLFSVHEEPTPDVILALALDDFSPNESSGSDYSDSDEDLSPIHCFGPTSPDSNLDPISLIQPLAKVQIFLGKYEKPISVIAFFDTGAAASIINPSILPRSHWQE